MSGAASYEMCSLAAERTGPPAPAVFEWGYPLFLAALEAGSLAGLEMRTAFPGGMLTSSPVRGWRPMPSLRAYA